MSVPSERCLSVMALNDQLVSVVQFSLSADSRVRLYTSPSSTRFVLIWRRRIALVSASL